MSTTSVRIERDTHEELKRLAEQRSQSQGEVVRDALESLKRDMFYDEMESAYEDLRDRPDDWATYRAESEELESTLADGLPDE